MRKGADAFSNQVMILLKLFTVCGTHSLGVGNNARYKLSSLRIRQNSAAIEHGARYQSFKDRWEITLTC